MDKVSVIIPVYNNEAYVERCLRSVMTQTYQALEILVVDDGSTDASNEIIAKLATEDGRIRVVQQENGGVASARNRGLSIATGRYLTFIDGDDYVSEDYVEHLVLRAQESGAQMVICGLHFVDESGKILRSLIPDAYIRFEREEWTFRISAVCSHLYERQIWGKYKIWFRPGERGEDMPISLFFSAVCDKIATLSEAGYFYVQHSSSAMHNFRGFKHYQPPCQALEEIVRKVQKTGVRNSTEFYELFVMRILATCFFDLGRGASRETMHMLCDYIVRVLKTYFPGYYKNRKLRLFADVKVPFSQKAAVWLLALLVRTGAIYPMSHLFSGSREEG